MQRAILDTGDVPGPGRYRVTATSGLNVHDAPSLASHVNATVPNGALGTSDGTVDNGFAYLKFDNGASGWASVVYLAPELTTAIMTSSATSGTAPPGPELSAGFYAAKVSDWLNLRSAPSMNATAIGKILPGEVVEASGANQNFFAEVKTKDGQIGWASTAYLVPAGEAAQSADLILTASDLVQLRTMLAAWAGATKVIDYGAPSDLALDAPAMARQNAAVEAFQKWWNATKGGSLRTDGVVDKATRDALVQWSQGALAGAPPATATATTDNATPTSDPALVTTTPAKATSAAAPLLLLGVAALGLFIVLEEKKKRKAG